MPIKIIKYVNITYNRILGDRKEKLMSKIIVFGGDGRQAYLAKIFHDMNCDVYMQNVPLPWDVKELKLFDNIHEIIDDGDVFLAPILYTDYIKEEILPLKEGQILFAGRIPEKMRQYCDKNNVRYYDYLEAEEVTVKNAEPTAIGAAIEAITLGAGVLKDKNSLVIGYGRCGKCLANKLNELHKSKVTVMARNTNIYKDIKNNGYEAVNMEETLEKYDYIFNTVPAPVLTKNKLTTVKENVVIIDIASKPGGTDFEYCIEHGINAKLCLSIPGRQFPKTAAIILYEYIDSVLKSIHHQYL